MTNAVPSLTSKYHHDDDTVVRDQGDDSLGDSTGVRTRQPRRFLDSSPMTEPAGSNQKTSMLLPVDHHHHHVAATSTILLARRSKIYSMLLPIVLLLLPLCLPPNSMPTMITYAYPDGAGNCSYDEPSVGGPHIGGHLPAAGVQTDLQSIQLSMGNFEVLIDGAPQETGQSYYIPQGEHEIRVAGNESDVFFRGILIRMQGVDDILPGPDLQIADVCGAVPGVTHVTADNKTEAVATFFVDTVGVNVSVDITIVVSLYPSVYYWSPLGLVVAETTSPGPSAAPTINVQHSLVPTRVMNSPTTRTVSQPPAGSFAPTSAPTLSAMPIPGSATTTMPSMVSTAPESVHRTSEVPSLFPRDSTLAPTPLMTLPTRMPVLAPIPQLPAPTTNSAAFALLHPLRSSSSSLFVILATAAFAPYALFLLQSWPIV